MSNQLSQGRGSATVAVSLYGCLTPQVFLAALLSRFRLHLAPSMGTPQQALDSLVFQVTITSANGVWVTAEER